MKRSLWSNEVARSERSEKSLTVKKLRARKRQKTTIWNLTLLTKHNQLHPCCSTVLMESSPFQLLSVETAPTKFLKFKTLSAFDRYRCNSWKELSPAVRNQKQATFKLQRAAESAWAEALGLPKTAFNGLHLIFDNPNVARIKIARKLLSAPTCRISITFDRSEGIVICQMHFTGKTFSRTYPFSKSLLRSQSDVDYLRASKFLRATLSEIKRNLDETDNKTNKTLCPQAPEPPITEIDSPIIITID